MKISVNIIVIIFWFFVFQAKSQTLVPVDKGWANNSVNTTVFRKNSIVTHDDTQFIAFYDPEGFFTLGKRNIKTHEWTIRKTRYKGNVTDAHNVISIMVDGDGYLHAAWDHHGHPLRYAKGRSPLSLELGDKEIMTGQVESNVTYPEFFRLSNGDLIFMYRDGQSGRGNLVINRYDLKTKSWKQIHNNLIDGENERNAYWQACADNKGVIHLSWVWRETWDVSTNHDMCYARSEDGGKTWTKSNGDKYELPINASSAEYCANIPQNSELINQTSITVDKDGNPYIASYWRDKDSDIPQYRVIYSENGIWNNVNLNFRKSPFSLSGGSTKKIPISRPQIVVHGETVGLLFRDEERGEKVSIAVCVNIKENRWTIKDLTDFGVGDWEPSFDTELWRTDKMLHLFVQNSRQVDGEGQADMVPQTVYVLESDENILK